MLIINRFVFREHIIQGWVNISRLGPKTTEYQIIMGLHSIMIQTASGLPVYEKQFKDSKMDPTLISGFSSALSSMFDDVDLSSSTGFQSFEAKQLNLTMHKWHYSSMLIISEDKLSSPMLAQLAESHKLIEKKYLHVLDGSSGGAIKQLPSQEIDAIFDEVGFKIILLDDLYVDRQQLENLFYSSDISRKVRGNFEFIREFAEKLQSPSFKANQLEDFLSNKSMKKRDVSQAIVISLTRNVFRRYSPNLQ